MHIPDPVDVHVGARLRSMRKEKKLSQQAVADQIGVSFQQLQKYEKGSNRISASVMFAAAKVLECTVQDFFTGLGQSGGAGSFIAAQTDKVMGLAGGRELLWAFPEMPAAARRPFADLAVALANPGRLSEAVDEVFRATA